MISQINMLDPTLSKSLVTWKENDCICSVFQPDFLTLKGGSFENKRSFDFTYHITIINLAEL